MFHKDINKSMALPLIIQPDEKRLEVPPRDRFSIAPVSGSNTAQARAKTVVESVTCYTRTQVRVLPKVII